jgi:ABC-type Fe3+-hydroxamate transport system substrate-binding protein
VKVIVCGGRDYWDADFAFWYLDELLDAAVSIIPDDFEIIEGGARGADALAFAWAMERGIKCTTVNANWDKYPKAAGPIRNGEMLKLDPDLVVAFPGGRGTANMIQQAEKKGVQVIEITP